MTLSKAVEVAGASQSLSKEGSSLSVRPVEAAERCSGGAKRLRMRLASEEDQVGKRTEAELRRMSGDLFYEYLAGLAPAPTRKGMDGS